MSPERRFRPDEDFVQAVMQRFVRDFPDVVLIGGWATYIRTRVAKSHDIDIIVDHQTLAKLEAKFQLSPSHHISGRKFEIKVEGVGVDVYPVYQSKLGQRLQIPVEVLIKHTEKIDRTRVLTTEAQFVAKMAALLDRQDTLPGEKDRREIWELLNSGQGVDFRVVAGILRAGGWEGTRQSELLDQTFDLLGETADLSRHDRAVLRLKRARAVEAARSAEGREQEPER
ncbi:MAG TPA: hypothetical protein VK256_08415 [Candidatus Eisenbacteria bacterium]|nr:hypothetical protein [Candidatus Eisenbacteria bacterium]